MICGGENGTNECHLTGFSEVVTFDNHFIATRSPLTLHPIGVLLVLAMPVEKLCKMMGIQLAMHPIVGGQKHYK